MTKSLHDSDSGLLDAFLDEGRFSRTRRKKNGESPPPPAPPSPPGPYKRANPPKSESEIGPTPRRQASKKRAQPTVDARRQTPTSAIRRSQIKQTPRPASAAESEPIPTWAREDGPLDGQSPLGQLLGTESQGDTTRPLTWEILEASHKLLQPQPSEELYQRVVDLALQVSGAERGFLMLLEGGDTLRFKFGRSVDRKALQENPGTSKTILGRALETGRTVELLDSSLPGRLSSDSARMIPRSILCVPLVFGWRELGTAHVGGVLYLDTRVLVKRFLPGSRQLVEALADHAAAALSAHEHRRQLESIDPDSARLNQNFRRLIETGFSLNATLDLDKLLRLVMEKALEVSQAERGFLLLRDSSKREPTFQIGLEWNGEDGPARRVRRLTSEEVSYDSSICYEVLNESKTVVLQQVQQDGMSKSRSSADMGLCSVMVTPLKREEQVLGLIYVDSRNPNLSFSGRDAELLEALAAQAATGLQNALLFAQVVTKERIESEIAIAAQMQSDLCPKSVPKVRGLELIGYMKPAREVGGDYYDFVPDSEAPQDLVAIVVGDVSGKGLGSGMAAVMARCFLRPMLTAYGLDDPGRLLRYLNAALVGEFRPGLFMTMVLMVWDADARALRFSSAGHEKILVWRAARKEVDLIASGGSPLGLSATRGGPTTTEEIPLSPGDTVVLYTDGVTEAMNDDDEEFTLERFVQLVKRVGGEPLDVIEKTIRREVKAHRGQREPSDDVTIVVLRCVGEDAPE